MLSKTQEDKATRIQHVLKVLKTYNGTGIEIEKFISSLILNYGFSKIKAKEYLDVLIDTEYATLNKGWIKAIKEVKS